MLIICYVLVTCVDVFLVVVFSRLVIWSFHLFILQYNINVSTSIVAIESAKSIFYVWRTHLDSLYDFIIQSL